MTIIILDDSELIRKIIEIHLDKLDVKQEKIMSFSNGYDALNYIKENDADLVFCDISMPQMNGDEFARDLFQFRPDLKKSFFVISSEEDQNSIQHMKKVGAQRFIKKPLDEKKFNHLVKSEIEKIILRSKNSLITLKHQKEMIDKHIIISQTNLSGRITYVSQAFCDISGYSKAQLIGSPHKIVRHPDTPSETFKEVWETIKAGNEWKGEIKNLRQDGSYYWVHSTINPIYNELNNKIGYTSVRVDISDKKKIEELTRIDELTGTYNRRAFNDLFQRRLNSAIRMKNIFCFILLDIDNFKKYNDTYGHPNGDIVLKAISQCLMNKLYRADDYCFRLGGEEFGVIFEAKTKQKALMFTEQLRLSIENLKIDHSGNDASDYVTASFGMRCISKLTPDVSQSSIYKEADQLLYKAKENGRNQVISS